MGQEGRKEDEGVFGAAMEWEGNKEAEGEGEIQKEGECSGMGKGIRGKGTGAVGFRCKKQPKEIEHQYRKCKP